MYNSTLLPLLKGIRWKGKFQKFVLVMNQTIIGPAFALAVSTVGNLSLGGFFLSAVFNPSRYSLPADYGMIIFVLEFLNVHASAMAYGAAKSQLIIETQFEFIKKNPKLTLVGFYLLAALSLGIAIKSWVLPAYFAVGLVSKFFGRRATQDDRSIVYLILLLLFSFVLGMRLWPGVLFFLFILGVGIFYTGKPGIPQPQLFRTKLDLITYAMPLIIFLPFQSLSWLSGISIPGENFWAILYFPSLAANDVAVFIQSRWGAGTAPTDYSENLPKTV